MPTEINALVADARRRFRAAGIQPDEAALDARLLAQHVLGWDAARLLTHGDEHATSQFQQLYESLAARRVAREPLAYITGMREFWQLAIEVTPAVLIPRPETELLIEAALDHCERMHPLRIVDVCTGSGCVAIAIAREFAKAGVVASDISADALEIARRNVARHGLTSRVRLLHADLLACTFDRVDLVVANPPYVPSGDAPHLQPEVRDFEPRGALVAGPDGLQIVRRLVAEAGGVLARGGVLMFEFGAGQAEAVAGLIERSPDFTLIELRNDLQDIPRVAVAQRA
jgi:release factor glutamine methyltransferase